MTGMGAEEIWEGVWKNTVSKEVLKVFHSREGPEIFCVRQNLKNPAGFDLGQTLSYCTSIQILMRSLQYANMITFRSDHDSNLNL